MEGNEIAKWKIWNQRNDVVFKNSKWMLLKYFA